MTESEASGLGNVRSCEVCGGSRRHKLHRQYFLGYDGTRTHYDVVACDRCGFIFADDIPTPAEQNTYYAETDRHQHAASLPLGLAAIHRDFFRFITDSIQLNPTMSVLDIGSSIGHFLNYFKASGLERLLGIEPSPDAHELAKAHYGIEVRECALDAFDSGTPFDLVTVCGVLEHIGPLRSWLARVAKLNREGGYLFIAVPDAESFSRQTTKEPYLEFAAEHINFFTAATLENLITPFGYEPLPAQSVANTFYGNSYLLQIFKRTCTPLHLLKSRNEHDRAGEEAVCTYINAGRSRMAAIEAAIAPLIQSGHSCVIWGAGSLFSRLCATTRILDANIVAIIDRGAPEAGGLFLGRPLRHPNWLRSADISAVLITSYVYQDEIRRTLEHDLGFKGLVIGMPS